MAWKFKYEKAEQEKLYAQTHQKTVEVVVENIVGIASALWKLLQAQPLQFILEIG